MVQGEEFQLTSYSRLSSFASQQSHWATWCSHYSRVTAAPSHRPWHLISLHIPTDRHHHHPANSYSCGLLGVRLLFSSNLVSSPRERTADCHQAPKQVLASPCDILLCVALSPAHTWPGHTVWRSDWCQEHMCPGILLVLECMDYTHCHHPTIPNTCVYTTLFCVMSKKHKNILGQEPQRPVVPNE